MNEIRLSGVLAGVAEHTSEGQTFITATLNFVEGQGILIVAAGGKMRQLQPFDDGDSVRVTGRLATFRENFAVMVDEVSKWTIANLKPGARYMGGQEHRDLCDVRHADAARGRKISNR